MVTIFSRSAIGNATRASEELNGPMIASTFSSFSRVRTPTTACSGFPEESNVSIRTILPLMPPPALISSTAICAAISLVFERLTNGPVFAAM